MTEYRSGSGTHLYFDCKDHVKSVLCIFSAHSKNSKRRFGTRKLEFQLDQNYKTIQSLVLIQLQSQRSVPDNYCFHYEQKICAERTLSVLLTCSFHNVHQS